MEFPWNPYNQILTLTAYPSNKLEQSHIKKNYHQAFKYGAL